MHYVLSDIHGNERRFRSVLAQIRLQPEDTLYVLGDVVDRYPGGVRILRQIMAMSNAKMLLGNHEYMMLRALGFPYDTCVEDGTAMAHWYRNGGDETHRYWKRIRKTIRQEVVDYLLSLPLHFDVTVNGIAYKLVHAAPAEEYNDDIRYPTAAQYAVWRRLPFDYPLPGNYVLIFGHTPTKYFQDKKPMEVWYGEQRIGIDCGSGFPEGNPGGPFGRLACLRLEDGKVFYSQEDAL